MLRDVKALEELAHSPGLVVLFSHRLSRKRLQTSVTTPFLHLIGSKLCHHLLQSCTGKIFILWLVPVAYVTCTLLSRKAHSLTIYNVNLE